MSFLDGLWIKLNPMLEPVGTISRIVLEEIFGETGATEETR